MDEDTLAMGIFAGMIVLGTVVAFWAIYWEHQKQRLRYEERRLMIERGLTPPEEAKAQLELKALTTTDYLRRGTLLLFLGIGLALSGGFVVPYESYSGTMNAAGVVIGLLGVGNLVYWRFADRRPRAPEA